MNSFRVPVPIPEVTHSPDAQDEQGDPQSADGQGDTQDGNDAGDNG